MLTHHLIAGKSRRTWTSLYSYTTREYSSQLAYWWQRWNDNSSTGDWDADLKRFVYDGAALAQEHTVSANHETNEHTAWAYTYGMCEVDYLRKPDGIRQKVNNGVGGWDLHLLFNDGADVASRTPSGSSTTITRTLRTASGDRLNDNPRMTPGLTTGSFNNISNLAKPNSYIESYGGGTELGTSSLGFDSLEQSGPVHQLPGLGGMILGSPPAGGGPGGGGSTFGGGIPVGGSGGGAMPVEPSGPNEDGRMRLRDPSQLGSGRLMGSGSTGGRVGDSSYTGAGLKCNCGDCLTFIDMICMNANMDRSWESICCDESEGISLCVMALDPCLAAGKPYSCGELICGGPEGGTWNTADASYIGRHYDPYSTTSTRLTCICPELSAGPERAQLSQVIITIAWTRCGWCRGFRNSADPCDGKSRQCDVINLNDVCSFRPPSPYHICRWQNANPGSDETGELCQAALADCNFRCWQEYLEAEEPSVEQREACLSCCTGAFVACTIYLKSGYMGCMSLVDFSDPNQ